MKITVALVLMLLSVILVAAQTPAPAPIQPAAPNDREMALSAKLVQEINDGLACRTDTAGLRRQIDTLQAEVAKLKAAKQSE